MLLELFWLVAQVCVNTQNGIQCDFPSQCDDVVCRLDEEHFVRNNYIDYLDSMQMNWYSWGGNGEYWRYDCSGLMYSYFANEWLVSTRPSSAWLAKNYQKIHVNDAVEGDLVIWMAKSWTNLPNHTSIFVRKIDDYNVEIIDWYPSYRHTSRRPIPLFMNEYNIMIIKNPYIKILVDEMQKNTSV